MSEPSPKPEEPKPTHNQQAWDDFLWEIPFARPIWNYFVREGKAVKNGWVSVAIIVGVAVFLTRSCALSGVDERFSDVTNSFSSDISNLKGQLADAMRDRDKYQTMLAPFEAMAIAKYTNAPMEQRLELLIAGLNNITNVLNDMQSKEVILSLIINDQTNITGTSIRPERVWHADNIFTVSNRYIGIVIVNHCEYPAAEPSVDFISTIDATNVAFPSGWQKVPKQPDGNNAWYIPSEGYLSSDTTLPEPAITISTNYHGYFTALIKVNSGSGRSMYYRTAFTVP
jgi:hypothetical protein